MTGDSKVPPRDMAQRQGTCLARLWVPPLKPQRRKVSGGLAGWKDRQAAFLPSWVLHATRSPFPEPQQEGGTTPTCSQRLPAWPGSPQLLPRWAGNLISGSHCQACLPKTHSCLLLFTPARRWPPGCPLPPSELGRWLQC